MIVAITSLVASVWSGFPERRSSRPEFSSFRSNTWSIRAFGSCGPKAGRSDPTHLVDATLNLLNLNLGRCEPRLVRSDVTLGDATPNLAAPEYFGVYLAGMPSASREYADAQHQFGLGEHATWGPRGERQLDLDVRDAAVLGAMMRHNRMDVVRERRATNSYNGHLGAQPYRSCDG